MLPIVNPAGYLLHKGAMFGVRALEIEGIHQRELNNTVSQVSMWEACTVYERWKKVMRSTRKMNFAKKRHFLENGFSKVIRYYTYTIKKFFGFQKASRKVKSGCIPWKFSILCRACHSI
ncbi:hypothetical protein TNCT_32191 [Trichonephila clavata]|uniref:Uncharacterized protein n=1 Tax=Trichonephila clavata TaxID=2740835 RepID=A0A8X6HBS2_TRICU|nr:hypothetical protein TNCT_32191 [Trichonephila clavata]